MTVFSALGSDAILTVKFHINPVSNFTVFWSIGGIGVKNSNVKDTVNEGHIETTYFIRKVTNKQLGNYTVQVINWAIASEHNEVTFNVILEFRGTKRKVITHILQADIT